MKILAYIALLSPVIAYAQGLQVECSESCEVGELVRIDARASDVQGLSWEVLPPTPDFEVITNERSDYALFSSRVPGEYLIIIAGAKDGQAFLKYVKLVVIDPGQSPGIAVKMGQWLKLVKMPTSAKVSTAKKVSGVFRTLASADLEVAKILEATASANKAALGDDLEAWRGFLDALGTELDFLLAEGKLNTREQYATTWKLIASELEKAANKCSAEETP